MVHNCVAYNCSNLHDKRNAISFHTFPFKRPEVLNLWIEAIRRENWVPSKSSRLCGAHFLPTDYLQKPGCTAKILKPDAVPSIFSFPEDEMKLPLLRRNIAKQMCDDSNESNEVESNLLNELHFSYIRHLVVQLKMMSEDILKLLNEFKGDIGNYAKYLNDSKNFSNGAIACEKYAYGYTNLETLCSEMLEEGLRDFLIQIPNIPVPVVEKYGLHEDLGFEVPTENTSDTYKMGNEVEEYNL